MLRSARRWNVSPLVATALIAAFALCEPARAKDFGVAGQTFEISEEHLIGMIERKLRESEADGRLAALQEEMKATVRKRAERPRPVEGMSPATEYHSYTYDPTVTAEQDYFDLDGNVVVAKGTTVNPFDMVSLPGDLLFIDGDRPREVDWAFERLAEGGHGARIILVNGAPLEIMRERGERVYFDQNGALSRQLDIIKTPSRVTQSDRVLLIEEIPVEAGG